MANSNSTSDIVKGALFRAGEQTDGSSPYHPLALKSINDAYLSILAGASELDPEVAQVWSWARVPYSISLLPYYSTTIYQINGVNYGGISVSVVQGSLTATLSAIPVNLSGAQISFANYFFNVINTDSYYQIKTHVAGTTTITLDAPYLDVTGSLLGFNALPLQYNLGSGILRLAEPFRIYVSRQVEYLENYEDTGRIYSCDLNQLRHEYPLKFIQNDTPTKFATLSQTDTSWVVQFNKYCTYPMKVDFDVILIPNGLVDSSDDVPIFPRAYRQLLEFVGAAHVLIQKGDSDKAQTNFALAKSMLQSMKNADNRNNSQTSNTFGRLIPRQSGYARQWSALR